MGTAPNTPFGVASSRAGSPAGQLPGAATGQGWGEVGGQITLPPFQKGRVGSLTCMTLTHCSGFSTKRFYLSNPTLKSQVTGKRSLVPRNLAAGP